MTLRDQILNTDDQADETIDVPEWGVKVGVKGLTLAEQQAFLKKVQRKTGGGRFEIDRDKFAVQLVVATAVDPDSGERLFDPADAQALSQKSAAAMFRLVQVGTRLSGLGGDEQVEEAIADLKETASDDTS